MKKERKAIIPVAGLGTRFLPTAKAMPEEMLPIVDKPTIQYIVEKTPLASKILSSSQGKENARSKTVSTTRLNWNSS
ncbi:hypothetical protein PthBH41_03060 [Parageobacillus thermoglucosidasius]|nr:UTP--glucose-1-phosphate uridylyltransferase [Anoxybacillus flavithermus]OAO84626.1 UTP--glucose-1-phosphate uridylyltransferase [Parageobacillus thermoglucosidasius]BDG30594.1 hypothetical protein PthBH41_03060 [Parageobacillus thermoglucosidasius]